MGSPWPRTMPALITAFNADGSLDADAHRHNTSVASAAGARGILVAGSTGEGPYLEEGERETLVSLTRDTQVDLTVICGVSAETDRQAYAQIAEAASGGADAVLVMTPGTLVRGRARLITDFYVRIANASPLPILLYTVPPVTGYELPVDSVLELVDHPNIVGMKDSGGDASRLDDLAHSLTSEFTVYAGASRALADSGDRGAHGTITASSNYAWKLADAAVSGDRDAQSTLVEITSAIEPHGVPGTKFAASLAGMHPGHSRLPLQPLAPEFEPAIRDTLDRFLT